MYRKFWLTNGTLTNGNPTTVQLTEENSKIYLNNPTGLGMAQSIATTQYADVLQGITTQNFAQVGGEILFWDDSNASKYDKYNKFVEFLTHTPLTLFYQIPTSPTQTYSMDVDVLTIDKTEVKTDGLLRCNFSLQGLSRWKGTEVTKTGTASSYSLTNNGHLPCGFEITITGTSMMNPYITLEQDSELYGEAKFDDTTGFNSVYVNSNDGEQEVILEQGGSVLPNPLSYQDLSISNGAIYVTFVKLARGISTLTIGMDSGSITGVTIKYTPLYRSV